MKFELFFSCGKDMDLMQVEPVSTDGVKNPQKQDDIQRGVVKGYGFRWLWTEVCV